jgi:hypothetical protein
MIKKRTIIYIKFHFLEIVSYSADDLLIHFKYQDHKIQRYLINSKRQKKDLLLA